MRVWIIVYRDKDMNDDWKPVARHEAYLEDDLERAKSQAGHLGSMILNESYEYKVLLFSGTPSAEDHHILKHDQDFDETDEESEDEYEDEPEEEKVEEIEEA